MGLLHKFEKSSIGMWLMALIHLHVVLFWCSTISSAEAFKMNQISSTSRCPYTATKNFISNQANFIKNIPRTVERLGMFSETFNTMGGIVGASSILGFNNNNNDLSNLSSRRFNDMGQSRLNMASTVEVETTATKGDDDGGGKKKKKDKKRRQATGPLEVVVFGLSHHKASVDVREKLAIPEDEWNDASAQLCSYPAIEEAAVLSTCNRFEIYVAGSNQYDVITAAADFCERRGSLDQMTLRQNIFMLTGEDAIWHLLRVSAGLDSIVVGEGQILSQVKRAYEHGIADDGSSGKVISRMLNTAVSSGKRVRSETGISKGAVSISSAAAEFTAMKLNEDCNLDSMEDANISIIGAGTMARLLLVHLQTQGVKEINIINRSPGRVDALREEFSDLTINYHTLDKMAEIMAQSDVVYPSTAATEPIINAEDLNEIMKSRDASRGGLQLVDISVPRNVAKDCDDIEGVASYNVDDLKQVVARNTAKRKKEMIEAEGILRDEMEKYRVWQQSLGAIPTIAKLQEKAEELRLEEFQKASKKLSKLSAKDQEAVERLSKGIVAKLLHGPMNHLRQQKQGDDTIAAIESVKQAFQLRD